MEQQYNLKSNHRPLKVVLMENSKTQTQNKSEENGEVEPESSGPEVDDEPETKTVDNLADNLKDLVPDYEEDNIYVEIPKVNLDSVIAKNSEIHETIDTTFKQCIERYKECFVNRF